MANNSVGIPTSCGAPEVGHNGLGCASEFFGVGKGLFEEESQIIRIARGEEWAQQEGTKGTARTKRTEKMIASGSNPARTRWKAPPPGWAVSQDRRQRSAWPRLIIQSARVTGSGGFVPEGRSLPDDIYTRIEEGSNGTSNSSNSSGKKLCER